MIPDIIRFFNGGGIPMFQDSGKIETYDIKPAVVMGASPETMDFFQDFANRYNNLHGIDPSAFVKKRVFNDKPKIKKIKQRSVAGFYTPITDGITLDEDDLDSRIYTHELTHKLNDAILALPRTSAERRLLRRAYGRINPATPSGVLHPNAERFTSNTETRRRISDVTGLLGKELDEAIMNMSDEELGRYFGSMGYVNPTRKVVGSNLKQKAYNRIFDLYGSAAITNDSSEEDQQKAIDFWKNRLSARDRR
jgi:hypothetical protein